MAVKYQCPKCGRRFVEWGAQKLDFLCPHDNMCDPAVGDEELIALVRMGAAEETKAAAPALSRRAKPAPKPKEEVFDEEETTEEAGEEEEVDESEGDDEEGGDDDSDDSGDGDDSDSDSDDGDGDGEILDDDDEDGEGGGDVEDLDFED